MPIPPESLRRAHKEAGACECVRCQQVCGSSGDVRYGGNARDDGDLRSEREGLQQTI